jgi:hypothetical protein
MKLNSCFPARNRCNEIATTIFYQQVTEGQLIKKEPIHEGILRENLNRASTPQDSAGKKTIRKEKGKMSAIDAKCATV